MRSLGRVSIVCAAAALCAACLGPPARADTEPDNNLRHRAEAITPGTYSGQVGGGDERDWYKFPVTGGDIIRVSVDQSTGMDVSVELRDHEDSYLEDCERGRTLVYLTPVELGQRNWYVCVDGEGTYRFTLETTLQNDAETGQDAPDAFEDAVAIGGGRHSGMLCDDDEQDTFKFMAAPGQVVTIELQADFSRFNREMDSVDLQLRSPDDSYLEGVSSYGDKETLTYGPLGEDEAGEMRIVVSGEGDYHFFVPLLGPGPSGPSAVTPTPTGEPQTLQFGGAGRFRIMVPVSGEGDVEAQIEWKPSAAAEVMLFAPGQKTPVARTRGAGSAQLTYAAGAAQGGEWMLQIVPQPVDSVVQGTVSIQFPGSDSGSIKWQTFTPSTALGKAALSSYLRSVERVTAGQPPTNSLERHIQQRMTADSGYAADLTSAAQAQKAMPAALRLEVLGSAGSGASLSAANLTSALQAQQTTLANAVSAAQQQALSIATQPVAGAMLTPEPGASSGAAAPSQPNVPPPPLVIRFNYIYAFDETTWDGGSDSDEIYYMIGLIGPDGRARGFMSDEFGDFDRGEARPHKGVAAQDIIWQGEITGDTYCVLVLMEHDWSSRSGIFRRFLSSLEDSYADINNVTGDAWNVAGGVAGGAAAVGGAAGGMAIAGPLGAALGAALGALFGWIVSGMADDMIGEPVAMLVTPEKVADWSARPGFVWSEDFRGGGAHYGLMFTFGKERHFGD